MINCVEDITPSEYKDIVTGSDLKNSNKFEMSIDSDMYEYFYLMHWRHTGSGTKMDLQYLLNGSTFTADLRTDIQGASDQAEAGLHGSSTILAFDTAGDSCILMIRLYTKDDEGTKLVLCKSSGRTAGGAYNIETQCSWRPTPTEKLTSFGFQNISTGTSDFLLRAYRCPRGLPYNFGDVLFTGDVTAEKVVNIDPVLHQTIGYDWQGTTGYKIDINNLESTDYYNHQSIRNATSNGLVNPPSRSADDDLIESNNTHCTGFIKDVPNSKRVLLSHGGSRSYNPSVEDSKYTLSTNDGNKVNVLDFKPNVSLDGYLTVQRNMLFPHLMVPLHVDSCVPLNGQDLDLAANPLDLSVSTYFSFIVCVFSGYSTNPETLRMRFNNQTSYNLIDIVNNASNHTASALQSTDYAVSQDIGTDTTGNFCQVLFPVKAINNTHTGFFTETGLAVNKNGVCKLSDTNDISSVQVYTTDSSEVFGKFQVFGIL